MFAEAIAGLGIFSVVVTLIVCFCANALGRMIRVMDIPEGSNGRKRHERPTPMVGGIALLAPVGALIWMSKDILGTALPVMFALAALAFTLGFLDDRYNLGARWRLFVSLLAVLGALWWQPMLRIDALAFSFLNGAPVLLGGLLGAIFTAFALVGLQNAVNMADGKNGLVPGLALIWALFLAWSAPAALVGPIGVLAAGLAIVLAFNLRGRLFLGDAGSYGIAVVIGLLAIIVYNLADGGLPADVVALWFWVPVADCLRLMTQRLLQGNSPFEGDRAHFHHLLSESMSWRHGLIIYLGLVAVPGAVSLISPSLAAPLILLTSMVYALMLAVIASQPTSRTRQEIL